VKKGEERLREGKRGEERGRKVKRGEEKVRLELNLKRN
jgi:hypothetical protein